MRRTSLSNRVLTCLVAVSLALAAPAGALASTRAEAELHAYRARKARQRAAAQRDKAADLVSQTRALENTIEELESEIGTVTTHRERLETEIDALRTSITDKEAQIAAVKADYDTQTAALAERIDVTYRAGDYAYIQLLLEAGDLTDLIERTTFVQRVMEADVEIAQRLERTRLELETVKAELDRDLAEVNTKRAEVLAEETRLRDLAATRDAARDEKLSLLAETKRNISRLEALAKAEENESSRIEAELSGGTHGGGRYAGTMSWPVPGYHRISSPFGYRIHPITHTRRMHRGIDIGTRGATPPIVAAGNGRVIYAGWRGGYGKCTMIDHGDGLVSVYAHQSSIGVRVGARVSAGQRIGRIGSTGFSTGPHLHFETRVNGVARNPMNYL